MKVLMEPEAFRYGRCGAARYYAALYRGLREAGVDVDLPLIASGTMYHPARVQLDTEWSPRWEPMKERLLWWANSFSRRRFHRRLASGGYDLVLLTSSQYHADFLKHAGGTPFLMVCHDTMRSVTIPGGAIDAWSDPLYRLLYLARRAASVVCVSDSTRRDLAQSMAGAAGNLNVVRSGNLLPLWAQSGSPEPGLPESYFLFVGSRQVRKNFNGTVRALAPLLRRSPQLRLICTGKLSTYEIDFLQCLGVEKSVVGMEAGDALLVTLYERALALVFPSFYEGFGLPVLEAMACGCPVIASNLPSHSEVAGEAALLVDPGDESALAQACERIAAEPQLRAHLAEAGRRRASLFTFDRMMKEFLAQMQAAAERGPGTERIR